MRQATAAPLLCLVIVFAVLGVPPAPTAASNPTASQLFAQLCGDVGGADASLPTYPAQPQPMGEGVVVTIEDSGDLDDLLSGRKAAPPPGSVISMASGTYADARWMSSGGRGIGFAGSEAHPITWYARQQYGVEVTSPSSYRAMQLNHSDAHHRFIGFHVRDGRELFLSEADGTEFLHGRISGSTAGGAWKWRGVAGGPEANGMRFLYNVVSTANSGSNFARLEGLYIGDGRNPELLTTRQSNFEISHNCIIDAPGGAIDVKANSTDGLISHNFIDSTDHFSGGINALPGWQWLPASVRAVNPNVRSAYNRITVVSHPNSDESSAGSGLRVNGSWRSTGDVVENSSNVGIFVLAQADLELVVNGLESTNNTRGAARRGGSGSISLVSSGNRIDQQGNLLLNEAAESAAAATTTTTTVPSTPPPTTSTTIASPVSSTTTTTALEVNAAISEPGRPLPAPPPSPSPDRSRTEESDPTPPGNEDPSSEAYRPVVDEAMPVNDTVSSNDTAASSQDPTSATSRDGTDAPPPAALPFAAETDNDVDSQPAPPDADRKESIATTTTTELVQEGTADLRPTAQPSNELAIASPEVGDAWVEIDDQGSASSRGFDRTFAIWVTLATAAAVALHRRSLLTSSHVEGSTVRLCDPMTASDETKST